MAGILGSLLLIAILAGCAMIPVVGWLAGVLIFLFALGSVLASIGALIPHALKATAIWGLFLVSLMPEVFHPVASPLFMLIVSLAVASLGRLFHSGIVMRSAQYQQNVSGYTTRAGVQVGDYTRTVTKKIPVSTTSVNPVAVALGSNAGQATKDSKDV